MSFLGKAAISTVLALAPLAAGAAPLDLAAFGYDAGALLEDRVALIDYDAVTGFLLANDAAFELEVSGFDALDPAQVAFSLFAPGGPTADLFGNTATAFGEDGDTFQYLFEGVGGSGAYAALDGGAVLVELGASGSNLLAGASGLAGNITLTSLTGIAPVPLPAGAVLLITGIAAFGAVQTRRKRA